MIRALRSLLAIILLAGAMPALAQPGDALRERADAVVAIIRGEAEPATVFSPGFLAQVPVEQVRTISTQLQAAHGPVQSVKRIDRIGPLAGTLHIGFARALVQMRLVLEDSPPHLIGGLLVSGVEPRGTDSAEAIIRDLQALPGESNFQIARLGDGAPVSIAAHAPDRALAIGSTFKLIILAELSRQVQAGQRRWSDVVPIDRHSLPSGITQDWPLGSPATLHTLAALMISRSDNTATDVLLRLAGRENVEAMMTRIGMGHVARNRPFLSTIELFQIKADTDEARARWAAAEEAERRRLLAEHYESGAAIDLTRFGTGGPVMIDTAEWFASPADLVKVMDWLRRNGGDMTTALMAIGPGMDAQTAGGFAYVGFKGGSEPGVINLTYLIRNNAGVWHVVTGGWNNPAAPVDEARFAGLMLRAARLVR